MTMSAVLFVLFFGVVSTSAQCPPCDCFSVDTTNTTLDELIQKGSPQYTQVVAQSAKDAGLDTVCLTLTDIYTPDHALVEMANTYTNTSKPVLLRPSIQKFIEPGHFLIVGPPRTYRDFVLGNPCPGTYVIYRCIQTGTCVTDRANVDVFVGSIQPVADQDCIDKGIKMAQEQFPEVQFYPLPRTAKLRCTKEIVSGTSNSKKRKC